MLNFIHKEALKQLPPRSRPPFTPQRLLDVLPDAGATMTDLMRGLPRTTWSQWHKTLATSIYATVYQHSWGKTY